MRQLMHSFRGTHVPHDVLDGIKRGDITSICLFAYNVESPQQVKEMVMTMRDAAQAGGQHPPIIGIDQEGGQLIAITGGATELPGNMALGATQSPELARKAGQVLARELLAMGINMNFAPSLDVNINPKNPVVGIRSFGDNPRLVSVLGVALIDGLQSEGVIASAKHFPGHGDTNADSHHATPQVDHALGRIHDVELTPFRAAIEAGVQSVMSSHIIYSALDDTTPTTLSYQIMHELLRLELGFTGLTITDAMDMHAVANLGHVYAVRQAIFAGNDLILLGHLPDQRSMVKRLKHLELVEAVARIDAARAKLTTELPEFSIIGCDEHQAIAQAIADKSITVVRDNGNLPLRPTENQTIAIITVRPADLTPADTSSQVKIKLADAIRKRHSNIVSLQVPHDLSETDINSVLNQVDSADVVIIGTISAEIFEGQAALVEALQVRGHAPIVVAMRTPYDLIAFPEIKTYLCAYGIRDVTTEAIAKVLFGEIVATGVLPCDISALVEPSA